MTSFQLYSDGFKIISLVPFEKEEKRCSASPNLGWLRGFGCFHGLIMNTLNTMHKNQQGYSGLYNKLCDAATPF